MKINFGGTKFQDDLCAKVDALCDATRDRISGPNPGRMVEYQNTLAEAQAYADAGFTGVAGRYVQAQTKAMFRNPNWTDADSARDILATNAAWQDALITIREMRLATKKNIIAASGAVAKQQAYDAFEADFVPRFAGVN